MKFLGRSSELGTIESDRPWRRWIRGSSARCDPGRSEQEMRLLKRPVFVSVLLFVVYAILMVVYFQYTVPIRVPPEYAGTPVDPAEYLTPERIRRMETYFSLYFPYKFI